MAIERSVYNHLVLGKGGGVEWWRLVIKWMAVWEHCFFSNADLEKMKEVETKVLQILGLKALCYVLMSSRHLGCYQEETNPVVYWGINLSLQVGIFLQPCRVEA